MNLSSWCVIVIAWVWSVASVAAVVKAQDLGSQVGPSTPIRAEAGSRQDRVQADDHESLRIFKSKCVYH